MTNECKKAVIDGRNLGGTMDVPSKKELKSALRYQKMNKMKSIPTKVVNICIMRRSFNF